MTDASYDGDFFGWAVRQADAIRRRSANELDWDNLAEEVDGLARTERRELYSRLVVLLTHLLKWAYQPTKRSKSWVDSSDVQRLDIRRHLGENPSLQAIEREIFLQAYVRARIEAARQTRLPRSAFPLEPPFTLEQAKDDTFWPGDPPPAEWL